ncbi:hypothetical protein [Bradyrhizobium sp.]|uniref:hypothetical protein n=1 Tax=Bradyrhizobium sp. TaxID=376 RepID=UPI00343BC853
MTESDPTDEALATIASILDQPAFPPEAARSAAGETPEHEARQATIEGYSKSGPGPVEAIRFRWTVRHEADGRYFVDETIGENSRSITNGPMSADAAIRFVDDQASEARQRFESLRNEMAGRAAATDILRKSDSGVTPASPPGPKSAGAPKNLA